MKKLSTAIIAALALLSMGAHAKDGKDRFAACRADFDRLCKDVKPGDGRQMQCMMENRSRLSGECGALIAEKQKKEEEWKRNKAKHQQHSGQDKPTKVKN